MAPACVATKPLPSSRTSAILAACCVAQTPRELDRGRQIDAQAADHLQEAPPAHELADFLKKRDGFNIVAGIGYELARLPQMLSEVALRLATEGCILSLPDEQQFPDGKFPGGACALITRTVVVPSTNPRRSMIIKVIVRASYEENS